MNSYLREFRLDGYSINLHYSPELFLPNSTTLRFSRCVDIEEGSVVFDLGTGIGPLAIFAAKKGASKVYASDSVNDHVELARRNVRAYDLEDKIMVFEGDLFSPFEGTKADTIIADVSGIADGAARALGWYPKDVPTGGYDGTDVVRNMLEQAPLYMKPSSQLYFGIAIDLADHARVLKTAKERFGNVVNADHEIKFPLTTEQLSTLHEAYLGNFPRFITPQNSGSRHFWRGQIYKATEPRM